MIRLTRRYRFSASHRLHLASLDEARNRSIYGKCSNPGGHGHDYTLEVSVEGPLDEATGRVVNVEALDRLVRERVLAEFDHRNLNEEVPDFAAAAPTTENVTLAIRRRLRAAWSGAFSGPEPELARVRVHETRKNVFEVGGRS